MGLMISRMFQRWFGNKPVRLLMVGLDAAGKTSILYKLKLGETIMAIPTVGFNLEEVECENLKFTIWDVGGQKKIRTLWRHYYENSQAIIFVVDSADHGRISCPNGDCHDCARCELHYMLESDLLQSCSVLVFANKQDLPGALAPEEVGRRLGLPELSARRKWYVQPSCALDGRGLKEGFAWLSKNVS
eukprot:gnl/Trimastix_PCT/1076.p2 GENE.gnl/Trimastix_PCT/1076~~gnl/Trimastix_PCT/1076.p2  ORF type:complete len:188 (+),score=48.63 gnl/Trimastix_PCT/1076:72-635(+)